MGYPTIFPTDTTVYDPERCWNGYTVFTAHNVGATVIDMNGNVVKQFERLDGFPTKLLLTSTGAIATPRNTSPNWCRRRRLPSPASTDPASTCPAPASSPRATSPNSKRAMVSTQKPRSASLPMPTY